MGVSMSFVSGSSFSNISQSQNEPIDIKQRFLLLGQHGVGRNKIMKTLLACSHHYSQLCQFHGNNKSPSGNSFCEFSIKINPNENLNIGFCRLSPQNFQAMNIGAKRKYFSQLKGIILVYDVQKRTSFEQAKRLQQICFDSSWGKHKILLRLKTQVPVLADKMQISTKQHKRFAQSQGLLQYEYENKQQVSTIEVWRNIMRKVQSQDPIQKSQHVQFKAAVLGQNAVGKSLFISSIKHKIFEQYNSPTLTFEYSCVNRMMGDTRVKLRLLDTPQPKNNHQKIVKQCIKKVDAIFLLYDLIQQQKEEQLQVLAQQIEKHANHVPVVFMGNKIDKFQKPPTKTNTVRVLAKKYKHYYCSAKTRQNVDQAVTYIIRQLVERNKRQIYMKNKEKETFLDIKYS